MPVKHSKNFKQIVQQWVQLRRDIPTLAGTHAVVFFKENFVKGGFMEDNGIKRWEPRKDGRKGAVLVKTARLKRSIRVTSKGASFVRVGTDVPYAKIHNEGGVIKQTVTAKQRAFFFAKAKAGRRSQRGKWQAMALSKKLRIPIPQRKFIGNSAGLDKRINRDITRRIFKIFN